jgi:glycine reductase
LILIISRASGAPVIANSVEYATQLIKNDIKTIAKEEFSKAKKAGLTDILNAVVQAEKKSEENAEDVVVPKKEVCTEEISGIEVMDLDDAVKALWSSNIYAEAGMGCTGPVIMIKEENADNAKAVLKEKGFM